MGLRLSNQSRHAETAAYSSTRHDRTEYETGTSAKRLMDIAIASLALVFVFPLLLVVGTLIRLQDGGKAEGLPSGHHGGRRGGGPMKLYSAA